ncbi:DUF3829 domain-containing protein [Ottowia sp. GY511]|uniref:YiiG family protein n=1 Tax=Ottowia flava TaxID=2675430 RepID=A0ABW4KV18_9BURK|nr:YiiG family protein [Ottowia sp. GY511]TXK33329.1 DUF3829 domain-containing protein [Ottowia sp. GY511]
MTRYPSRPLHGWPVAATALALAALSACGEKTAPAPAPAPAPAAAPAPTAPPAPPAPKAPPAPQAKAPASESQKLNEYVACYNGADSRAHDAMNRYRRWVQDMKTGPTGKERNVLGVYTVSDHSVKACAKLPELADAAPPLPELDQAAKPYAAALTAWAGTLAEADKYYSRQDYKDDKMAKGKAMHADLVKHFEAFDTASKAFSQALETANDKRQTEQLAELEKSEGRKFNYWHIATMMNAKKLTKLISEDSFDVDQASAALKAFEDAAQGLTDFAKQAPKDELPMMYSSMGSAVEDFLVAAKQRIRRVRDKVPYSQGEKMNLGGGGGWMVNGSPDALVRKYNDLIGASNRLR